MQILKTTSFHFDVEAERQRITTNFKGRMRLKLLAILDTFVGGDWDSCGAHLRALNRQELEFVHCDLFDVMRSRAQRQLHAVKAEADGGPVSEKHRVSLAYPKFQVGEFIG